jgi:hypothetical protein
MPKPFMSQQHCSPQKKIETLRRSVGMKFKTNMDFNKDIT